HRAEGCVASDISLAVGDQRCEEPGKVEQGSLGSELRSVASRYLNAAFTARALKRALAVEAAILDQTVEAAISWDIGVFQFVAQQAHREIGVHLQRFGLAPGVTWIAN